VEKGMETFLPLASSTDIEPWKLADLQSLLNSHWLFHNMDALTRRVYYEREKMEVDMLDFVYHEWDEKLEKEWQLANESLKHAASDLLKLMSPDCCHYKPNLSKLIDQHERACNELEKRIAHQQIQQEIVEMHSLRSKYSQAAIASIELQALCDLFCLKISVKTGIGLSCYMGPS
jgi:hypothetical protein